MVWRVIWSMIVLLPFRSIWDRFPPPWPQRGGNGKGMCLCLICSQRHLSARSAFKPSRTLRCFFVPMDISSATNAENSSKQKRSLVQYVRVNYLMLGTGPLRRCLKSCLDCPWLNASMRDAPLQGLTLNWLKAMKKENAEWSQWHVRIAFNPWHCPNFLTTW